MSENNKDISTTEQIVSYVNESKIIDTILNNNTSFVIYDRNSKERSISNYFSWEWKKRYIPIKANINLIKTKILLFPTWVSDYWNKETLIRDIKDYIYKYVDIPKDFLEISSYYVLLTYVYDKFSVIPYLRIIWDYWTWKSRLMKIVSSICYNSIMTNWWTSLSAIFRIINKVKWTLSLDEADFQFSWTQSEIIKLLNNWYQKWNPIMRADWEKFDLNSYEVFWPKIIGWRFPFKDKATESRCLTNVMKKSNREDIPTDLDLNFEKESEELRNKLLKFRFDYYDKIEIKKDMINGIEPRLSQIINPILSLIDNDKSKQIVLSFINQKQKEMTNERKGTIFGIVLEFMKNNFKWKEYIYFQDIINNLDNTEPRHNITHRKLWAIFKSNLLYTFRKNNGTVIPFIENMERLKVLYQEYGIE